MVGIDRPANLMGSRIVDQSINRSVGRSVDWIDHRLTTTPTPCPFPPYAHTRTHTHTHAHSRIWRAQSLLVGSDCSWGIADEVSKTLGIGPMDLEECPGQADAEAPLHVRCVPVCMLAFMHACVLACLCVMSRWPWGVWGRKGRRPAWRCDPFMGGHTTRFLPLPPYPLTKHPQPPLRNQL
jgi:hypothetical protein